MGWGGWSIHLKRLGVCMNHRMHTDKVFSVILYLSKNWILTGCAYLAKCTQFSITNRIKGE